MQHLQHVHMTQIDRIKFIYSRKKIPPIPTSNHTFYKVCDPTRTHPYTKTTRIAESARKRYAIKEHTSLKRRASSGDQFPGIWQHDSIPWPCARASQPQLDSTYPAQPSLSLSMPLLPPFTWGSFRAWTSSTHFSMKWSFYSSVFSVCFLARKTRLPSANARVGTNTHLRN